MSDPQPTPHIPESPSVNCLLLCDDILESKRMDSQKHYLRGIINSYRSSSLPLTTDPPVCYARMMDLRPGAKVGLKIVHHDDPEDVVLELKTKIGEGADPLGMYTFIVPLPPLTFKQEGRYDFSVQHKGVDVVVSPIRVTSIKPPNPEGQ